MNLAMYDFYFQFADINIDESLQILRWKFYGQQKTLFTE